MDGACKEGKRAGCGGITRGSHGELCLCGRVVGDGACERMGGGR